MADNDLMGGSEHEVIGPFGAPVPASEEAGQLRADELNLFDATAVAVSSVAPAYSLASTMSFIFVIAGIGLFSPSALIVSFIPVLFVAIAYFHLNRRDPDCGASYAWLSKLASPWVGWFNGWVQVATSAIFCISAPLLAGSYTLQFLNSVGWINDKTAANVWLTAVIAAAWLVLITFICVYGIRWTTNFQWILVIIEYVAVIGFSIGGIIKVAVTHPHGSTGFHFGWLNPFHITSWSGLMSGVALGVFFFWGWDTALNLNEESKDRSRTPGRAGIISMWLLLVVFLLNFVAIQMLLTPKEISDQGANVLFYFGDQLFGHWAGYAMIFAVITSTVATTQTTLLPAARIAYSMSRDKVFPRVFGSIHPRYRTPAIGTMALAIFSMLGIMLNAGSSSASDIIGKLILNIGVLVAFDSGATGLTCGWAFRKVAFTNVRFFFTGILLPVISGAFLLYVGYVVITSNGLSSAVPDLIVLGAGIPLVILARLTTKGDFFKTKPIAYDTID
jgi:amino acid transporter